MKCLRRWLSVLLTILLIMPGTPVSVGRVLLVDAAESEEQGLENVGQDDEEEADEESAVIRDDAVTEEAGIPVVQAEDDIASGSYENIVWVIDASGKLTVSGTGDFADSYVIKTRSPWYDYREQILSAEVNVTGMTDASYMFFECSNLVNIDLNNFNTENITNMGFMFSGCSSLTSLDVSGFETGNVTNMSYMFQD